METKKTKKADLSRRKGVYFNLGLVLAMAFIISAFEYKSYGEETVPYIPDIPQIFMVTVDIPITRDDIPKPPKPEPQKIVKPIFVVDNSSALDEYKSEFKLPDEVDVYEPTTDVMPPEPVEEPPFRYVVEEMPSFEGGQAALMKYIAKNIRYPRQAKNMGIDGKVFVEFIIDEKGKVTAVKTIKGIGAGCDEEAVRVLQESPLWSPGKQRHIPVKVKMVIPIIFELNN